MGIAFGSFADDSDDSWVHRNEEVRQALERGLPMPKFQWERERDAKMKRENTESQGCEGDGI